MSGFTVFDVETPNRLNHRMSAIGVTVVENGKIMEEYYRLVNPETHFDYFNTQLTGISEASVRNAPTFPEVWEKIEALMEGRLLVAHNASFDMGVLKKCLMAYGLEWRQSVHYLCTVQMGKRLLPGMSHKLDSLCAYYGIPLIHHQAASDSRACAEILLRYLRSGADARQYVRSYSLR